MDEIEHRGHQIEDFDSKINIPRSKYIWKAKKKSKIEIKIFQNFVKCWPDPTGYMSFSMMFDLSRPSHTFTFLGLPWALLALPGAPSMDVS